MSAKQKQECVIIVHGLHQDGRPRAAAYGISSEELAGKAAEKWKLRVGYAVDEAGLALAKHVPSGLQHPFGKVDAPVIKRELYDLLLKVLKAEPIALPSTNPETPLSQVSTDPWQSLKVGDVVLYSTNEAEGFFKCKIESVSKDGRQLSLRWLGWPKLPLEKVAAKNVALLRQGK